MQIVDFKWNIQIKLSIILLLQNLVELSTKPTSIFILGMHRSGTSCLTGILGDRELYLGKVNHNNPFNHKGNQENFLVNKYNEELLNLNHGSWYEPQKTARISLTLKYKIAKYCLKTNLETTQQDSSMWVIKDPRLLFCLSSWRKKRAIFVGTFRHPKKVASSLYTRSQKRQDETSHLSLSDWEELWFKYNIELINLYQQNPFPIVNFDWEQERYLKAIDNILIGLGLNKQNRDSHFFDSKLINQNSFAKITTPKHQELYAKLIEIAEIEEQKNQNVELRSQKDFLLATSLNR